MKAAKPELDLMTIGEVAALYDADYWTISGLIRAHGIETKKVPRSPNAKGLDSADRRIIAKALNRDPKTGRRLAEAVA